MTCTGNCTEHRKALLKRVEELEAANRELKRMLREVGDAAKQIGYIAGRVG